MDVLFRAATIYLFLMVMFRFAGKRTLAQLTAFDFVLLLIIGESTQQALLGDDFSVTNALLVISTLIGLDIVLGVLKRKYPHLDRAAEGSPMILVEDGRPLADRMRQSRVSIDDVLASARQSQGLENLDQIKYAILEVSGGISIIPKREA